MALRSAGILLALGLSWFAAAVALPVWQARSVVDEVLAERALYEARVASSSSDNPLDVILQPSGRQRNCYDSIDMRRDPPPGGERMLESLGGPRSAVRKLALYLRSPVASEPGRWAALELIVLCRRDGVPALAGLMDWRDPSIRQAAATSLGDTGGPEVAEPLVKALRDPAPGVRYAAVAALGRSGSQEQLPELAGMLDDDDRGVRLAAIRALGRVGRERAVDTLGAVLCESRDPDIRQCTAAALMHIGPSAADAFITGLAASCPEARDASAICLGRLGGAKAKAALMAAKANPRGCSYYVLIALCDIKSREAREQERTGGR